MTNDTQTTVALIVNPNMDATNTALVSDSLAMSTSLGGRVRKTTQTFTFSQATSDEPEVFSPPLGTGVKLRDMEFVAKNIEALGKKELDMIKQLYSIMYGRRFQQKNVKLIKDHILDFSGIVAQDERSREILEAKMGKWKLTFVHDVMDLLAVDRSKKSFDEEGNHFNKEMLLNRLIEWLYKPQITKKAEVAAKREKQKMNKRVKKTREVQKSKSDLANKKRKTTKKDSVAIENKKNEEAGSETSEPEGEESSSDFEDGKNLKKKSNNKRRSKKSYSVRQVVDDKETDNFDENLAADTKKPSSASERLSKLETKALDADLCNKVRDIIAHGNVEELTIKKIVRQLSSDLGRDMTSQKTAIKKFIQAEV